MMLGSNGEYASLNESESLRIAELASKTRDNNKLLLVGASNESVFCTLEFIRNVADKGADIAVVQPPNYFVKQISKDVIVDFYYEVADQSPIPILVYNSPSFCNQVNILPDIAVRLAMHDNIIGMKQTSAVSYKEYEPYLKETKRFSFLAGSLSIYGESLQHGATGAVLSFANFMPIEAVKIHQVLTRMIEECEEDFCEMIINSALRMNQKISGDYGVAGVKGAMDHLGLYGGSPRKPLKALSQNQRAIIADALTEFGQEFLTDS
jgi:4-hydroxy-2-oxoglutarate aldolase